ncbi:hypothetical protein GPECTOR_1g275 [Gonium pectorale]|uniref:Nuclear pore complex protein NUP160 domain-containing protein n=1 Tax=Gonium pectorale TaxID=33097 RepID=A0A150H2U9_GONPE|nr:hypothetical protein GPECTOR_1g275 [Gonium pectorale]|eukprot:KXZ56312.1 hypothetical protein GPECTOR_1g275 [Gonium pectorale]
MSSLNAALRQETAFVSPAQPHQASALAPGWASHSTGASSVLYDFTLQGVGGALFLQDCVRGAQPERGIHWQIENSVSGALHLTEFTVHGGAAGPRTTVEVGFRLFPALAATGTPDGRLLLAGLLSNGYLLHTELHCSPSLDAVLSGLSADTLRPLDLTQPLASLGTPTSLTATPEAVLIGGSNGAVLCVPLSALSDCNASRCYELRDSSWALTKLIPGMLYRPRQPAALACVPVGLGSRQLLLVAYDDCMLRVYNISRRQQLGTLELDTPGAVHSSSSSGSASGGSGRHLKPTFFAAEAPAAAADAGATTSNGVTLVAQFEAADSARRYTFAYTLSASAAGRLSLSSPTALAVEDGGVVSEARVSGDTVWLLVKSQSRSKVLGYSRSAGTVVSSAVLAEAAGEHVGAAAAAASNGAEVDEELWEWLLAAFPTELSAEAQVCQQVLVPGQTCRASLRDALSYHGATLRPNDVDVAPPGVLRGWMQSAVMAIQRRTPTASPAECWQTFLSTYRAAWARRHPPLGLVLNRASPLWLGLARGGSVLAVLRRGTAVEALQGADVTGAGALELPPHLDAVHRCAAEAGALLGPLAGEGCLALLAAGVDPLERLLPRLSELWFGGPGAPGSMGAAGGGSVGGAPGGGRAAALTDSAREAQQRWRQRRQQLIIACGQRLGGLANPVASVQSYLGLLRLMGAQAAGELAAGAAHGSSAGALTPSRAAASFLISTCRQVSRAAAAAARDAALLLGLLVQQCGLGPVPLERGALGRLEAVLLPEACELLRRSALGLWLTGTSSSQDEATDMEPALSALRHLRLGPNSPAKRTHAEGPGAEAGAAGAEADAPSAASGDVSLAARLLPAFCSAYAGGRGGRLDLLTGAEAAGLLFTLHLQYGEQPSSSMAARVLQLGYQLFQAGEYGNLAELAALAGATGASEAGPQFLRGLGITCALALERQQQQGMRQLPGQPQGGAAAERRAERIGEAAGCFFRAAASLASEAGDTLRSILRDLRAELSGSSKQPEAGAADAVPSRSASARQPQRREVALLQLHFCEAVMQLFEREGAPEGAVLFAAAALEHLRAAYGHTAEAGAASASSRGAADSGADAAAPLLPGEEPLMRAAAAAAESQRAAREGRLWSNIYSYCVDLRQYERAYGALLANPLPAARLQSLRHLVHVLAQEGQLQTLCTLPFAGIAVLTPADAVASGAAANGGTRTVSLLSEALDLLHRRAHNCDLAESPQPYKVLYDFLVCRSDFKGAARAMAAYAWRLRAEAPGTEAAVSEALRAYDLAINCLSLLDPEDAWLDLTDTWVEKLTPRSHAHTGAALPGAPSGGAAGGAAGQARGAQGATVDVAPVATVKSLQRERTMLHYCALVAARVPGLEPMRQWDNEDAILRQLLLMGRYEGALALVADCYGGHGSEPWVRAMEAVVGALAAHCTRLQLQDGGVPTGGGPLPATDLFADDADSGAAASGLMTAGDAAVAGTLGGRAAPLWGKLRQLLAQVAATEQQSFTGVGGTGGGVSVSWLLRDAAAEAVLRTDPRVDLPQWLLDLFVASDLDAPAAMGSTACGPASLLGLYLRHDRLAAAVELVASQVEQWGRADVRLRRQHGAAWMPYPQLELLHTKLSIAQQLGQERSVALTAKLNAAMAAHLELVATDAERLQQKRPTGPPGGVDSHAGGPPLLTLGMGDSTMATPVTPLGGGLPVFGAAVFGAGIRLFG